MSSNNLVPFIPQELRQNVYGVSTEGRVILADPNDIISEQLSDGNGSFAVNNGTPPYENMAPYVEFTAVRRMDAVLNVGADKKATYEQASTILSVNLLNFDPETNSYTTDYTDDLVKDGAKHSVEGFGIESVNVKINANYTPEVTVVFVDVRATALVDYFGGDEASPVSVLFDFPPPLFKLRMKGAYGRFIEYELHMINHNVKGSDSGNITITVNFIGKFFGPLTDVLVGYLKAVPYMLGQKDTVRLGDDSSTSIINGEYTNLNSFAELLERGGVLYTKIDNFKDNSILLGKRSEIETNYKKLEELQKKINAQLEVGSSLLEEYLLESKQDAFGSQIVKGVSNLQVYYSYIANSGIVGSSVVDRIIQAFINEKIIKPFDAEFSTIGLGSDNGLQLNFKDNSQIVVIKPVFRDLISQYEYTVDFAPLSATVADKMTEYKNALDSLGKEISGSLATITESTLGLKPTIGNILEVLCNDFDSFLDLIREAGESPKDAGSMGNDSAGVQVSADMPWPFVTMSQALQGNATTSTQGASQRVVIYPGTQEQFKNWPEVQLVEKYCKALTDMLEVEQEYAAVATAIDPSKFIPISASEIYNIPDTQFRNDYLENAKGVPANIYNLIASRYTYLRNIAFGGVFAAGDLDDDFYDKFYTREARESIIRLAAKTEAHNIAYAVDGSETLAAALLNKTQNSAALIYNQLSDEVKNSLKAVQTGKLRNVSYLSKPQDGFRGIQTIVDKKVNDHREYYTVSTGSEDNSDSDRTAVMKEYGSTFTTKIFGSENTPQISMSKLLLFEDKALKKDNYTSDFMSLKVGPGSLSIPCTLATFVLSNAGTGERLREFVESIADIGNAVLSAIPILGDDKNTVGGLLKAAGHSIPTISPKTARAKNSENKPLSSKAQFFALVNDANFLFNPFKFFKDGFLSNLNRKLDFKKEYINRFLTPGVMEVPRFYAAYIGYLCATNTDNSHNVLSEEDRAFFVEVYDRFDRTEANGQNVFAQLLKDWEESLAELKGTIIGADENVIGGQESTYILQTTQALSHKPAMLWLMEPVYIINRSSLTWGYAEEEVKLKALVDSTDITFNLYIDTLFSELSTFLGSKTNERRNAEKQVQEKINDPDFKTQIYYNFKTLYDRWLAGKEDYRRNNDGSKFKLYDRFRCVTRSHQDIAQISIVDFKNLIDDSKSVDVSVYTTIASLLTKNNYQFFPLTSFMDYQNTVDNSGQPSKDKIDDWRKSFEIVTDLNSENIAKPVFMCMYVGGYSASLNTGGDTKYGDDGFSFGPGQPEDFTAGDGGNLFAFRTKYGSSNQSIFGGFEIDMKEFKQTDVSLKMESNITDQNTDTNKIRKSQNLLNIYSQRSYSIGIDIPLGNMCIQPTQYFQLEGLPIFKGAYIIHEVEHSITAGSNRLSTKFRGYRMTKFIYRVIDEYTMNYLNISGSMDTSSTVGGQFGASGKELFKGNGSKSMTEALFAPLCTRYNYPPAIMKAFIDVETNGAGFHPKTGKLIINFERDNFARKTRTPIANTAPKRAPGVDAQANEYASYEIALTMNPVEAKLQTSWGLGQIMGSNHKVVGYSNVDDMISAFDSHESKQVEAMFEFIKRMSAGFGRSGGPWWRQTEEGHIVATQKSRAGAFEMTIEQAVRNSENADLKSSDPATRQKGERLRDLSYHVMACIYNGAKYYNNGGTNYAVELKNKHAKYIASPNRSAFVGAGAGRSPEGKKLTEKYGDPVIDKQVFKDNWIVNYKLPDWLLPHFPKAGRNTVKSIEMNRDAVGPFEAVMRDLVNTGKISELKTFDGCWVIRNKRGLNDLSVHSWGLAFDFNAIDNPLGGRVTFSPGFISVWRNHGWTCGADWKAPRCDGMHYEYTAAAA